MNTTNDNQNNYNDVESSLFKLDMPIGRLKFFENSILLFIFWFIAVIIYFGLYYSTRETASASILIIVIIGILFGLPLLYLNFINCAKRTWDITGNIRKAVWITTGLYALSFISVLILLFYLALIFMPGVLIKKDEKNNI